MNYALDRFAAEVRSVISASGKVPEALIEVQVPKPSIPADLCFPTFRAAKEVGMDAPRLAQELAAAVSGAVPPDSLIGEVSAVGPFLNFALHPQHLAAAVLDEILCASDRYGRESTGAGKTIVVDYSSPNVAKRMHVGHIRSTIIGQSLIHIFRALGYRVIGDNHLGDWGKQFGIIIASVVREGKPQTEGEEALAHLEAMYTRYSEAMKDDPALDEEARQWSLRLEQGNADARALWQWCVETTLQVNQRNYDRLGVSFDHVYGESFYEAMLPGMIQQALEMNVARREEGGAVVVEGLDEKLPTFLLQRSDGGTLYLTRDIATIAFRMREFRPDQIIYVIGAPQELHLRQLFALSRAMGYAQEVELVHVAFGTVFDATGQALSTRRGNMVYLETLLDEAVARARGVIEQKQADLSEEEKERVAEMVGIGAVIYNDLYQDPRRNITLDWDRMLSTEGNSATYLQYSYARCRSIMRKAEQALSVERLLPMDPTLAPLLIHPTEQQLLKHLARLPAVIREAGERYTPFVIADWCYTTAREFGVFFEQCPVLKAETPPLREARFLLVTATAQALKNGLSLLGIQAPERM
ncbi:MAG: arginine--tRNA ligase [Chloroflexaceae bacterium]|nr:arginine--tRNA ligase [Chloroflexaceae bacterium]